ncbi:enoyl-CoA hydratase-related protein [Streptomyces sp. TG1A-8]|uniref:enoyl-CoA-hydratase DpgB n=1 Tax=Streptomyces sp. TG1A-8 TaxID=3051385 RepID=UPI00265C14C8|nr:enoyl-CoA-hydratase DpgB [Streptomyces sp. TG1A-8]MDO0930049.1 enoyl-CoA hydratase-related protein [Streptomyces sp. TG1A-8]
MRGETGWAGEVLEVDIDGRMGLTAALVAAVRGVCDRAEDHQAAVVVLRTRGGGGAPGAFFPDIALLTKWESVLRRLERLPAASVAAMWGPCAGVALDAALAADYRIAHPTVELVPCVASGDVWPGMTLYRMSRLSQRAVVRRAVLFGEPVGVDEALAAGLVDEVAEKPAADPGRLVERLTGVWGPDLAIRRELLRGSAAEFEGALGGHLAACDRVLRRRADFA